MCTEIVIHALSLYESFLKDNQDIRDQIVWAFTLHINVSMVMQRHVSSMPPVTSKSCFPWSCCISFLNVAIIVLSSHTPMLPKHIYIFSSQTISVAAYFSPSSWAPNVVFESKWSKCLLRIPWRYYVTSYHICLYFTLVTYLFHSSLLCIKTFFFLRMLLIIRIFISDENYSWCWPSFVVQFKLKHSLHSAWLSTDLLLYHQWHKKIKLS